MKSVVTIEAVLKVTERCNIACSYCYMFYKGNDDYLRHPKYMSPETIEKIAYFLRDGAKNLGAEVVFVDLHGGEPLMLGYKRFDQLCTRIREVVEPVARLEIRVQTNATLIDHDWIPLFSKHRVGVGVSIDGDREINDAQRIDHKGLGTYDRTRAGLNVLLQAAKVGLIKDPGLLCVADPKAEGAKIYRHFIDVLGGKSIDFLLPMESFDSIPNWVGGSLSKYYRSITEEWLKDDNPEIKIRFLDRFISYFRQVGGTIKHQKDFYERNVLITIASNGDLGPDDDLKPINFLQGKANVSTSTLSEYLNIKEVRALDAVYFEIPQDCLGCVWKNYCRGCGGTGRIINRYSTENGFNNRSVFCDDLKDIFSHQLRFMLNSGLPVERATALLSE